MVMLKTLNLLLTPISRLEYYVPKTGSVDYRKEVSPIGNWIYSIRLIQIIIYIKLNGNL